jgi:hypothetical protein
MKPDNAGGRSNNSRRCDGNENVNCESDLHLAKHLPPTNSTDEGRHIDLIE